MMGCAMMASPVDNFARGASPVPNYTFLGNKWNDFCPSHKETLSR